MTIVIQNRYVDLSVSEDRFEVGLSFNQVPAKLSIPYAAVTSFVDPAVNFALQFQVQDAELDLDESETAENDGLPPASPPDDGPNVVAIDFKRKKGAAPGRKRTASGRPTYRSEERRGGKECVRPCRPRRSPEN